MWLLSCAAATSCGVRPAGLRRPLFYVVSWLQSEQAVLSLLECGVDQYMAFPLSLQRLRGQGVQRFEPAFMTETLFMIYSAAAAAVTLWLLGGMASRAAALQTQARQGRRAAAQIPAYRHARLVFGRRRDAALSASAPCGRPPPADRNRRQAGGGDLRA